jgi:hypothetical protein
MAAERLQTNMKKIINLTPHDIVIMGENGEKIILSKDGTVARVTVNRKATESVNGIPIFTESYGDVVGLPNESEGVYWIVSALVRQAVPWRQDVLSPGELIRDEKGQPIGCKGVTGN